LRPKAYSRFRKGKSVNYAIDRIYIKIGGQSEYVGVPDFILIYFPSYRGDWTTITIENGIKYEAVD